MIESKEKTIDSLQSKLEIYEQSVYEQNVVFIEIIIMFRYFRVCRVEKKKWNV